MNKITIERAVLEQALEALNHGITEMNHRGCAIECMSLHHATKAIREELAQPQPVQQGPVARVRFSDCAFDSVDWIPYQGLPLKDGDLLYTSPQAQPLTHLQAKALVEKYGNDPLHLIFQTEAAHGITKGTT